MNTTSNEAAIICARLLRQGYVHKSEFPQLELNDLLLTSVRDRLQDVGMELVMNSYSDFYAVKLTRDSQDTIEESNNLSLKSNEVAMLVILWSKLILPKRTQAQKALDEALAKKKAALENQSEEPEEPQEIPTVQQDFFQEQKKPRKKKKKDPNRIYVELSELYAEFGKQFGSKTSFKSTVSRLSNLKFIHMHNEIITEGVFLDLLIDGQQMGNEIKKSALAYKLAGVSDDAEWEEDIEEDLEGEDEFIDLADELVISEIQIKQDEES
ncbi:hypothetical protein [Candidatus Uabimicrobium amorphum]|uniref:DUF4194 domain-containing protein n=1 Tax=Uabimicrobium amorphum TaxID=2596890 RepID=A0A5S9IID3_UABAM|nr:hypothetical protein [Candidatus Uabimicrobium amorphum]BBM82036.1 hypothetical protein UABAM_00379 [Candidatus Uabimicrobium amorphum]